MQIENAFEVNAPPDQVYEFLLDVNRVVGCVPGAELSEVVDPNTFKGKVKIKVGPVTVAYAGTARITERDEAARTAMLEGEGRETTGPGNARAKATMKVEAAAGGSRVTVSTDFTVAGRVAQFGRGLMEDVSKSLVNQMAACIKSHLEAAAPPSAVAEAGLGSPPAPAVTPPVTSGSGEATSSAAQPRVDAPPSGGAVQSPRPAPAAAKPLSLFSILWTVLVGRLRALFGRR
ncbi:MAG: SRPBCC family protein [Candidatus Dormibacteraeota bacterium]|nr:SRPBCC family protein [Candidatus Dormibacteraeota bacterium]